MRASFVGLAAVAVTLTLGAAPSWATVTPEFTLTPASTQAGSTSDVATDIKLSTPDGDDVRDITISLAHGLLASPFAVVPCKTADFESDTCDPGSQIGQGTVTVNAYDTTVATQARVYFIQAQSTEIARIGMILKTPFGRVRLSAPVAVRSTPSLGVDLRFTDVPRDVDGVAITINRIELTLNGKTASGESFLRLPTRCAPATTPARIVSYDAPSAPVDVASSFTPTGCEALAFAPRVTASATLDDVGGLAFKSTIATDAAGAASSRVAFELPDGIVARPSVLSRACSAPDPATCPDASTMGTASALTSFAPVRLVGRIVLMSRPAGLPGLTVVFPAPFAIRIDGTTGVSPAGLITTTFDGLPDAPITSLEVALNGGAGSLLAPERELCSTTPVLRGEINGHNGASAPVSAPLTVGGCNRGGTSARPTAVATLSGLRGAGRRLGLTVTAPATSPAVTRLDVCLPAGLTVRAARLRASLRVVAGGRRVRTGTLRGRCVRIALPATGSRRVVVTLRGPALRVGPALARRVRRGRGGRLTISVGALDRAGRLSPLRPSAAAR